MELKSIASDVVSYKMSSLATAVAPKGGAAQGGPSAGQAAQANVAEANTASKVATQEKDKPAVVATAVSGSSKPGRTMSHIVESYNPQGKVRIKYLDSNNNVIYQIPTEMVAKTEDLMSKSELTTNLTA